MHASMFVPNTSSLFGGSLRNNLSELWGQAIWSFVLILCPSAAGSEEKYARCYDFKKSSVGTKGKNHSKSDISERPVGTLKLRNDVNDKIRWARIRQNSQLSEIDCRREKIDLFMQTWSDIFLLYVSLPRQRPYGQSYRGADGQIQRKGLVKDLPPFYPTATGSSAQKVL